MYPYNIYIYVIHVIIHYFQIKLCHSYLLFFIGEYIMAPCFYEVPIICNFRTEFTAKKVTAGPVYICPYLIYTIIPMDHFKPNVFFLQNILKCLVNSIILFIKYMYCHIGCSTIAYVHDRAIIGMCLYC